MLDNDEPFFISNVQYTDTDHRDRRRVTIDIPDEEWESFFEMWKEWCDEQQAKKHS